VSKIGQAEATALMMASLCINVVKDDPELVKRLRKLARKTGAPVDNGQVNETALTLIDFAVTAMALRAAKGDGYGERAAGRHELRYETVVIPVPHMEDGAAKSATALAVASFAVEYLHAVPGVRGAFTAWLDEAHPGTGGPVKATQDQLEDADQVLTMMAHVAGKLADGKLEEVPGDAGPHAH